MLNLHFYNQVWMRSIVKSIGTYFWEFITRIGSTIANFWDSTICHVIKANRNKQVQVQIARVNPSGRAVRLQTLGQPLHA